MAGASVGEPALPPLLRAWLEAHVSEDMKQVERLTRASADDPESEPYRSLYAARELLAGLRAGLCGCPGELSGGCREDWHVLCACLHLQLAGSYSSTEETEQGRESYEACLQSLEGVRSKVKTAGLSMVAYNQLGLLWGNRSERQKALEYLLKSKAVYESHIGLPAPLTEKQWLLLDEEVGESEREKAFEDLHTHTLFYLAQVYGNLSQPSLSALYCQQTLSRQLDTCCCDPIDWSLNAATLSQHYLGTGALVQARHCLACASRMLCRHEERVEEEGKEPSAEAKDQLQHTKADISLCWAKYSIGVLQCSKDGEDTGGGARARSGEAFTFHSLDVSELESAIPAELVTSYESARPLFLLGQRHLDAARQFYTMESFASDCVAIIQDRSLLYKLLAHFEADASLKCRMHKRRIDMLSDALNQLNPQHFLMLCRQLMYELAEIHYGMVDLKIVQSSESPSHHAIAKINRLISDGVNYFQKFSDSFTDRDGNFPSDLEEEQLRPVLCCRLYMARLVSKLIAPNPTSQLSHLHKAQLHYEWILDYHQQRPQAVERVFGQELQVCREMADLLPLKMAATSCTN